LKYTISEFSQITGISIYTLRYYEKEKLIKPARKKNEQRCYTDQDIIWIEFVKRLKDTGMSIKDIRKYSELRAQGEETMAARLEMLIQHRAALENQIAAMQINLARLNEKIDYYKTAVKP